ncbi:Uncharacterised protein [uncultured archaeon]|nr:Uncharacterised protein [uncultured archaeon]
MVNVDLKKELSCRVRILKHTIRGVLNLVCNEKIDKINCYFYLIECTDNCIREDDFLNYLRSQVIQYVLKEEELREMKDQDKIVNNVLKAIGKLVDREDNSELGELTLFCLLESQLNAVQLLNKMSLKTNPNNYYNGLDAIHISNDGTNTTIHFGESKVKKKFNEALNDSVNQVGTFLEDRTRRDFEVELIKSHLDPKKFEGIMEEILKYLNPYEKHKRNLRESISIFIGYSWEDLKDIEDKTDKQITEEIIKKYEGEIESNINRIVSQIDNSNFKKYDFNIFILPFKDVDNLKKKFNILLNSR